MDANAIRSSIKQSIARVTGIPESAIADTASYDADLGLDSLSKVEIAVDAEMCFRIRIPNERLPEIATVEDAVRIVGEYVALAGQA